jgi:hypothetical protein
MSYENPTTVVDTESAKIKAAGMASFGQSVAKGMTTLAERQREEAKERKKANLKEADDFIKYNDKYQENIWSSTDAYEKATGLDLSGEASDILDGWATAGATLKARRDRSDDPLERARLGKEIAIYDRYFNGKGMGNSFSAISELQATIQRDGAPSKLGRVGGLCASCLKPEVYSDFLRLGQGGKPMTLSGSGGVWNEATGSYSPLGLIANFEGGGTYSSDDLSNADLINVPDMQEGVREQLKIAGLYGESKTIDVNSPGFLDNFAKKDEFGKLMYATRTDVHGQEIRYVDIDFEKFHNTIRGTYDASIVSYSEGAGDTTSIGYREMKAYADDILDDIPGEQHARFKELTGFGVDELKLVTATGDDAQLNTILSKESYENYQKALAAKQYLEISNLVPGSKVPKDDKIKPLTTDEKVAARFKAGNIIYNKGKTTPDGSNKFVSGGDPTNYGYENGVATGGAGELLQELKNSGTYHTSVLNNFIPMHDGSPFQTSLKNTTRKAVIASMADEFDGNKFFPYSKLEAAARRNEPVVVKGKITSYNITDKGEDGDKLLLKRKIMVDADVQRKIQNGQYQKNMNRGMVYDKKTGAIIGSSELLDLISRMDPNPIKPLKY